MLRHGIIPVVLLCLTGQNRTLDARDLKQRQAWCYTASPIIIFYLQPQHWDMYQLCMATYTSLMYQQKGGTGDFSDHWQVSHKAGGNPWEGAKQPLTLLSCVIKNWGSKTMQASAEVDPQDAIHWEGLGDCRGFQVMARYLRNTLIPVSSSLKYLKVNFQE